VLFGEVECRVGFRGGGGCGVGVGIGIHGCVLKERDGTVGSGGGRVCFAVRGSTIVHGVSQSIYHH
jgi:hypothetical protein